MPEGLIDCYLHIDKYLSAFRQKVLFKIKHCLGKQIPGVWALKLSIDETPGDTVSHADGSDLIAANMLKRFVQMFDVSSPQNKDFLKFPF